MISLRVTLVAAATLAAGLPGFAEAQPAQRPVPGRPQNPAASEPVPTPTPAPALAIVPATPQQTTAVFADWTLRCTRAVAGPMQQFCEVVQSIQREDRPVAQIAVGRPAKGQPMQLTVLVPPSVSFGAPALLSTGRNGDAAVVDMVWSRCLPAGCIAGSVLADDALTRLRGWAEPGRITFQDGEGRAAALPFSPRGLAQALDALAREESS